MNKSRMSYFPYKNTFQEVRRCSQFGEACARDSDCMKSCPFGEVPAERMTCVGSPYDLARNMGQCQAKYARAGDPCVYGQSPSLNTCAPDAYGGDSLYCQQSLATAHPNFYNQQGNQPPTFALPDVGVGMCMPYLDTAPLQPTEARRGKLRVRLDPDGCSHFYWGTQ
jgi:hypothetical protein